MTDKARCTHCSFCGKEKEEVFLIIAEGRVFICDECVEVCVEMIDERRELIKIHFWEGSGI